MKLVILGSGNWGLAVAGTFSGCGEVIVWGKDEQDLKKAQASVSTSSMNDVAMEVKYSQPLSQKDILMIAVPSSVMRQVGWEVAKFLRGKSLTVVSLSKGLEQPGFKTMSQVLVEELPQCKIAVISGPTIAKEVSEGKATKAILASYDIDCLMRLKKTFENPLLRFELSLNIVEVEFCAALKSVIAIGVGIADGLNLGKNFMGLLLTYGLHEFMTIGKFLGISTEQVLGIGGLGDLITTSWSTDSRNHRFGYLLAQKVATKEALKQVGMVVEGVRVAKDVARLASLNVPVNIFSAVAAIIDEPTEENLAKFVKTMIEDRGIS
jgi:glycerol-3-phosphate dehydrogenase (NAD(P)+)